MSGSTSRAEIGPTFNPNAAGLNVLEPEHLVDVTEAASAVTASGTCVEIPFISRFSVQKATEAMTAGTIINAVFDILLSHANQLPGHSKGSNSDASESDLSDDDVLKQAESGSRLSLATLVFKGLDLEAFRARLRPRIALVREVLAGWQDHDIEVESFFMSPRLGLQGRVDILLKTHRRNVNNADSTSSADPTLELVEMKSGRPHISHQAQVAGYALLLGIPLSTRLWYVGQAENTWVSLTELKALQTRLLEARNSIVQTEIDLCQRTFGVLKAINAHTDGLATFQRAEAADFAAAYNSLDPVERTAFQAWVSFLAREATEQRTGTSSARSGTSTGRALADLWRTDLNQKRLSSTALTDLVLDVDASDFTSMHLVLRPNVNRTSPTGEAEPPIGEA
ncbi:MAG: hypothetical protein SGJ05_00450, partial [bacterium]|nr:hypothetical protein [bacterium]